MNWIVVRTAENWPCAIVRENDVPKEGISFGMSSDATERLETLIKDCDGPDEIQNILDEYGVSFEPIDEVATCRRG